MANQQKKEDAGTIRKVDPVIPQTEAASIKDVSGGNGAEQQSMPYAEFGGLSQVLQKRSQDAAQRRVEAQKEWERRLGEQSSARQALVGAAVPKDTSQEQRKLRNLAIGQAVGEFVGALFGGVYGLSGASGQGYVPKMPGMYRNTLDRLQKLRDSDIDAREKFKGLTGDMLEKNATDRVTLAREQYREAALDERQMLASQNSIELEAMRAENKFDGYDQQKENSIVVNAQQAEFKRDLQQKRHEQRLREQAHAAALKSGTAGMSDEVKYTKMLLLPQTRTTRTQGGHFPTTTVADRTSYSKQEDAAAEVLAKQVAPIRSRYALSDAEVRGVQQSIMANPKLGITWDHVADALARGMTPTQILESLE